MVAPMGGPPDRRDFLRITGGVLGWTALAAHIPALAACADEAARIAAGELPPELRTFTRAEAVEVEGLTALIVPSDDTPGAREAGSVYFIDRALAGYFEAMADSFRSGLEALSRQLARAYPGVASINELENAEAVAFLRGVEDTSFFRTCRDLTVMGMFANPEYGGNRERSGWRTIGFEYRPAWQPPFGYYDAGTAGDGPGGER